MTLEIILKAVCAVMAVAPEEVLVGRKIKGAKKDRIRQARQYGMYLSRVLISTDKRNTQKFKVLHPISFAHIGAFYGRKHETVIHSCKVMEGEINMFKTPANDIRDILRLIDRVKENGEDEIINYVKNRNDEQCRGEINSLLKCLHK
jgi:chromosomal replication initiation ATPase DnaA